MFGEFGWADAIVDFLEVASFKKFLQRQVNLPAERSTKFCAHKCIAPISYRPLTVYPKQAGKIRKEMYLLWGKTRRLDLQTGSHKQAIEGCIGIQAHHIALGSIAFSIS